MLNSDFINTVVTLTPKSGGPTFTGVVQRTGRELRVVAPGGNRSVGFGFYNSADGGVPISGFPFSITVN